MTLTTPRTSPQKCGALWASDSGQRLSKSGAHGAHPAKLVRETVL